jgi:2-methylisocitrate lyase-like PEP mutase family enzyme
MKTDADQPARRSLKAILAQREFIVAPGVYDLVSARIADRMNFAGLYMTGYGVAASNLGLPDAGLATFTDMLDRVRRIAEGTTTPLIADADTGYGGLVNVRHTVRGYEAAGAQAIQLEDQEFPKKCGHTAGRRVIETDEMVTKIRVAIDSRRSAATLIIARTDARTALGLDEAIRRAQAYKKAGADVIFAEAPESEDELARIGGEVEPPLLAKYGPGRPDANRRRGAAQGVGICDRNLSGARAAGCGGSDPARVRASARARQLSRGGGVPAFGGEAGLGALHELMGFPEVWEFERKYGRT